MITLNDFTNSAHSESNEEMKMNHTRRVGLVLMMCLVFALAVLVSGCGGGGSSSSSSTTGSEEPVETGGEETAEAEGGETKEAAGGNSAVVAEAEKVVEEFKEQPTELNVTVPIKKSIPSGKSIDFLTCESPGCVEIAEAFEQAADILGWSTKVMTVGTTADEIGKAYDTAIRDKPDGVAVVAVSSEVVKHQLTELEELEIPVVTSQDPNEPFGPIVASLYTNESSERFGRVTADYLGTQGCSEGKVLYVQVTGFIVLEYLKKAFEQQFAKVAPEAEIEVLNIPASAFESAPTKIVGALRANPDISCIFISSDPVATGLPQAIQAAGLEIPPIITDYGGETTIQYIKSGLAQSTIPPAISGDWGYLYADTFARSFTGESVEPDNEALQPLWIIEAENAPSKLPFAYVPELEKEYKELWGIK